MNRWLVLMVLTVTLVVALGVVARAGAGESGGIRPSGFSTKR